MEDVLTSTPGPASVPQLDVAGNGGADYRRAATVIKSAHDPQKDCTLIGCVNPIFERQISPERSRPSAGCGGDIGDIRYASGRSELVALHISPSASCGHAPASAVGSIG